MFEGSSILHSSCQPYLAYCGISARLNLHPKALATFHSFDLGSISSLFFYEIKICRFDSMLFSDDLSQRYAFLVQTSVKSQEEAKEPFEDANIFLEKDLDDLVEYSIILPRMFKRHHRYVLNMEKDKPCSFGNFTNKVELWKKATGIM